MAEAKTHLEPLEPLIGRCIKGDRQSQTQLYNLFMQKMFAVCLRYSSNREEAEEVLQEGFIKVFEHLHQYKFEGSFEGWIRKIMVNCSLQKFRNKKHLRAIIDIDTQEFLVAGHDEVMSKINIRELLKMVQQLPPSYRLVFNLFVFEGMKHREIAQMLGVSEGTSKSNLSDARFLLQKAVRSSLESNLTTVKHG